MEGSRRRKPERAAQYRTPAFRDWVWRIAGNAQKLRDERDWTQEEAAEHCGMTPQHYHVVERGASNLTLATLARLTKGFRIEPADLLQPIPRPVPRSPGRPPKKRKASSGEP